MKNSNTELLSWGCYVSFVFVQISQYLFLPIVYILELQEHNQGWQWKEELRLPEFLAKHK